MFRAGFFFLFSDDLLQVVTLINRLSVSQRSPLSANFTV